MWWRVIKPSLSHQIVRLNKHGHIVDLYWKSRIILNSVLEGLWNAFASWMCVMLDLCCASHLHWLTQREPRSQEAKPIARSRSSYQPFLPKHEHRCIITPQLLPHLLLSCMNYWHMRLHVGCVHLFSKQTCADAGSNAGLQSLEEGRKLARIGKVMNL